MSAYLVITSSYPRSKEDFAGLFVEQWCDALRARGHSVEVLAWRGEGAEDREGVSFVPYGPREWEGLFFGSGAPENLSRSPLQAAMAIPAMGAMLFRVLEELRKGDFQGVVGHWLVPGGLIARAAGAMTGTPSFVVGHSGGVHLLERLGPAGRALAAFLTSGKTTTPTEALREKLSGILGRPAPELMTAPMGFSPGVDAEKWREEKGEGPGLRIGFLGRLVPIKGLDVILDALKELRERGLELEMEVVGDGPMRRIWEERAGEGVSFQGALFGEEKERKLRSWDLLVVPSKVRASGRHEGLPVSLLEGAASGAIPFVSGIPGVEEVLARPEEQIIGNGKSGGSVKSWADALEKIAGMDRAERRRRQEESAEKVAGLAWPSYGAFWEEWLQGELSESSSRIS